MDRVLSEALALVQGTRQQEYGTVHTNFGNTARMWSVLLGVEVTAYQVVTCMLALKLCRTIPGPKLDTHIDLAGYAAILEELSHEPAG